MVYILQYCNYVMLSFRSLRVADDIVYVAKNTIMYCIFLLTEG